MRRLLMSSAIYRLSPRFTVERGLSGWRKRTPSRVALLHRSSATSSSVTRRRPSPAPQGAHVLDLHSPVERGKLEDVITRTYVRVTLSPCSELASHLVWDQAKKVRFLPERREQEVRCQCTPARAVSYTHLTLPT